MNKCLRDFPEKIPANHCFLKAWRIDLGKQVQVTVELPRNNMSVSVAFPMPLTNIPAVSRCLVEAGHLLVPWHSPWRSHKLVPLPQCLLSNGVVVLDQVAKSSCGFFLQWIHLPWFTGCSHARSQRWQGTALGRRHSWWFSLLVPSALTQNFLPCELQNSWLLC